MSDYTRYVWSRTTAHPVEHITHDKEHLQPLCGARLAPERLTYDEGLSGYAPECKRCKRKEALATRDRLREERRAER